jgi:hypothetical protein
MMAILHALKKWHPYLIGSVITYSCQGQQVIQVHSLHRKRPSATCKETHFGLKIQTKG